jgi:hypothetical protein
VLCWWWNQRNAGSSVDNDELFRRIGLRKSDTQQCDDVLSGVIRCLKPFSPNAFIPKRPNEHSDSALACHRNQLADFDVSFLTYNSGGF